MAEPFFLMLILHALLDYPLQGDWLSKAKNHTLQLIPGETIWPGALASHAAIHAGGVWLATDLWLLAGFEFVAHSVIDYTKCSGHIDYNTDQFLHIACKLVWFALLIYWNSAP